MNAGLVMFHVVLFFLFFFGVAVAESFVRGAASLYDTWRKCFYALVRGPCVGLAPGDGRCYLFRPSGLFGAIPTKTPVFPHQFPVSYVVLLLANALLPRFSSV